MEKDTWDAKILVWFKNGDWNTHFFHCTAKGHCFRNLIARVRAREEEMKQGVTKFYEDYIRSGGEMPRSETRRGWTLPQS